MKAVTDATGRVLPKDERAAWEEDLAYSHRAPRVTLTIEDRNEEPISSLTAPQSWVKAGGVAVDDDEPVSRQLQLEVLDPRNRLAVDPDSASDSALYLDNFLHVRREDYSPTLGLWAGCGIGKFRLEELDRDGSLVTITANSKEIDHIAPAVLWTPLTIRRGLRKTDAIQRLLGAKGETRFRIPSNLTATIDKTRSYGPMEEAWLEARRIARSLGGRSLDYDGDGYATVYERSPKPVITLREGFHIDGRARVKPLTRSRIRNVVQVIGGDPRGKAGGVVVATAVAEATSPLSPGRLGRAGFPLYLVERIENSDIRTVAEAEKYARDTLAYYLAHEADVSFNCLTIPHLEPGDVVELERLDGPNLTFVAKRFTIPLAPGLQSIGTIKRYGMGGIRSRGKIRGRKKSTTSGGKKK